MQDTAAPVRLRIEPLDVTLGLRKRVCDAIKRAITEMDIYGHPEEIRLDERQLAEDLGVSRTPIREALSVLEQEGFVRSIPLTVTHISRSRTGMTWLLGVGILVPLTTAQVVPS